MKIKGKIILSIMLCIIGVVNIKAFANQNTIDSLFEYESSQHILVGQQLVQLGEAVSRTRSTAVLSNFQNLQQTYYEWSNDVMQYCGQTIGNSGCCLTSFTMIHRYLGGADSPSQVNIKLGAAACPFVYATAASVYGYDYNLITSGLSATYCMNYIKGAISMGNPVLIGMQLNNSTDETHFVAAYGFSGDQIIISDPASNNYQYLSQYLDSGYQIYRLCTYFN